MSNTKFDKRDFRTALGQFPTGVTVITTVDENGAPIGCTASSFNSVSIDPALVLWSIDKGAFSKTIFEKAEYFAINVLSENQVETSNRFAGRGEDKFKDVSFSKGLGGAPLLAGCGAQFECKTWNVYEGGDHLIIVGEVIQYNHDDSLTPLAFSRGSYAITSQHPSGNVQKNEAETGNEFLDNYLLYLLNSAISKYRQDLYPKLIDGCDVTPEQWRVMTILSSAPVHTLKTLSILAMQPLNDLSESVDTLIEKGALTIVEDKLALTDEGMALQKSLLAVAAEHEDHMLSKLNPEQTSVLKNALKSIIEMDN
ncbi:flavin reductase [Aliiglaciecola sp. NS0011-25]|uniref:flavin reductase n=1 Tax=Aliiglaciecola sp. NS0011-25 TaxID=3127654 RepID=UPI003107D518